MKKHLIVLIGLIIVPSLFCDESVKKEKTAEEMIRDFTDSYKEKIEKKQGIFGIEVKGDGGGQWSIEISPEKNVIVKKGLPKKPTFYFTTDLETLGRIYKGEINAMTAVGRARASDWAPLDFEFMEGAQQTPESIEKFLHYAFHFFVRGIPEIVYYGEKYSRFIHGGNAVVFYYTKGLRSGWYQIKKGMVINKDERDRINPFPTLFICTRGEGKAKLDEKTISLKKGMAVYIPAGMPHMFWNEEDEPVEGVIIMFGEGA